MSTHAAQKTARTRRTEKTAPGWARELSEKYQSNIAHAFILHGNVQDFVAGTPGQFLKTYLTSSFKERDIVVSWDRSTGFTLPTKDMRKLFADICGITQETDTTTRNLSGLASGLNQFAQAGNTNQDLATTLSKIIQPEEALKYLSRALRYRATSPKKAKEEQAVPPRIALIIDYAESIIPATEAAASEHDRQALVTLSAWGRDPLIGEAGHILILIVNEIHDVNERLKRSSVRWEQIVLPFPNLDDRSTFLHTILSDSDLSVDLAPNMSIEDMARLTTGMRYIDLEDIVLRGSFLQQAISLQLVKDRKDEIMASEFQEVLSIEEHEFGFESLGGMTEIKQNLQETVITPMRSGHTRLAPQGILLMGPPGTGKTRLAKALAKESGVTFVELQLSKIFHKYVGDTERRLERALEAISAWRPCIVFIDEIDQAVGRGEGGDSGVSNRVFKRLMEYMADPALRGHVLFVGATNRPDLLDKALLRVGRFDKKIPILAPDVQERVAILSVLTRAAFPDASQYPTDDEFLSLAQKMDGYTGAEIENVLGKAVHLALHQPQMPLVNVLIQAYERIIPSIQNIEGMSRLALLYCNDLDLVPLHLRDVARELRHPQVRQELLEQTDEEDQGYTRRSRRRNW